MIEWNPGKTAPKDGKKIIGYYSSRKDNSDYSSVIFWLEEDEDGPATWCDEGGTLGEPDWWIPIPKHECVRSHLIVSSVGDDLVIFYYDHLGNKMNKIIKACPFCGYTNEN